MSVADPETLPAWAASDAQHPEREAEWRALIAVALRMLSLHTETCVRAETAERENDEARAAFEDEIKRLRAENTALRKVEDMLVAVGSQIDEAIREAERPKGGQHASPSGGDFWPVGPGVIGRFRWWSRESCRVLAAVPKRKGAVCGICRSAIPGFSDPSCERCHGTGWAEEAP